MQTETIDIEEAEIHFKDLMHRVVAGVHVVLCENHKMIAHLVPAEGRVPGLHAGAMETRGDFDMPLPDSFWTDAK